ncbi:MAG: hypothetical protein KDI01_10260 [Halioglobus sp.]|nr:hypothetical protein [Halioglobus sp.]
MIISNEMSPMFDEIKVRKAFKVGVPSALLLGLVMVFWPVGFWRLLGIELGDAPFPAVLYGSVIVGVGLASIAGARAPRSHVGLLLFLTCYKGVAVLFLLGHALSMLTDGKSVPVVVWVIAALWLHQAVTNARLYPWGLQDP